MTKKHKIETDLIRTRTAASGHQEHSSSIYMTSSFTFEDAEQARARFAKEEEGFLYSRYGNPSVQEFVDKMVLLEKGEAGTAVASGMSALFTALGALLGSGDHVLASRSLFGSTHQLLNKILAKWGVTFTYGDIHDADNWAALIQPNTKLCIVETPSNPALDLIDLEKLGDLCTAHDIILLVDNVFASPFLQNPIDFGANIVMHSTTKWIDGQGRGMGGVLIGDEDLIGEINYFARHTGPAMAPFNAWMFSKSLETLPVRMERHCQNALALANFLDTDKSINFVKYPHHPSHPQYAIGKKQMRMGGGIVTFELAGGLAQGRNFLDALTMLSLSPNLGDSRSIATHPASTTASSQTEDARLAAGITDGMVRISVGLEHIDDIVRDIEQALRVSEGKVVVRG